MLAGLSLHPGWQPFADALARRSEGNTTGDDALPLALAAAWLQDNYGISNSYLISPVFGYKYRTAERIYKAVFLDFFAHHPKFIFELEFYYKPLFFWECFKTWNYRVAGTWGLTGCAIIIFSLLVALASAVAVGRAGHGGFGAIALCLLLGSLWAALPGTVIFPSYPTMSDQVLMLDMTVIGWVLLAVAALTRFYSTMVGGSRGRRPV